MKGLHSRSVIVVAAIIGLGLGLGLGLAGGSGASTSADGPGSPASQTSAVSAVPADLTGDWVQSNAKSKDNFQPAAIDVGW